MRVDPDVAPRTCPVCAGALEDGGDRHTWCLSANLPRPIPARSWPLARAVDDDAAQHRAALANARELVTRLAAELDTLSGQPRDAEWAGPHDHRFRITNGRRVLCIERVLQELYAEDWRG